MRKIFKVLMFCYSVVMIWVIGFLIIGIIVDYDTEQESKPVYTEEDKQAVVDQVVEMQGYPPIIVQGNNTIVQLSLDSLTEALKITPSWLYKNCTAIYLQSDDIYNSSNQLGQSDLSIQESDGVTYSSTQTVHLRSLITLNGDGDLMTPGLQEDKSEYYRYMLFHELSHSYDFAYHITGYYDTSILQSYQASICENTNGIQTHCSYDMYETFADAMAMYVSGDESLPQDVRSWLDTLPK